MPEESTGTPGLELQMTLAEQLMVLAAEADSFSGKYMYTNQFLFAYFHTTSASDTFYQRI